LKLETLAQTWLAWFTATGFAYKHYDTISIIHISRTRAGLKLDKHSNPYHKTSIEYRNRSATKALRDINYKTLSKKEESIAEKL